MFRVPPVFIFKARVLLARFERYFEFGSYLRGWLVSMKYKKRTYHDRRKLYCNTDLDKREFAISVGEKFKRNAFSLTDNDRHLGKAIFVQIDWMCQEISVLKEQSAFLLTSPKCSSSSLVKWDMLALSAVSEAVDDALRLKLARNALEYLKCIDAFTETEVITVFKKLGVWLESESVSCEELLTQVDISSMSTRLLIKWGDDF